VLEDYVRRQRKRLVITGNEGGRQLRRPRSVSIALNSVARIPRADRAIVWVYVAGCAVVVPLCAIRVGRCVRLDIGSRACDVPADTVAARV
jgi:hypothetical protein